MIHKTKSDKSSHGRIYRKTVDRQLHQHFGAPRIALVHYQIYRSNRFIAFHQGLLLLTLERIHHPHVLSGFRRHQLELMRQLLCKHPPMKAHRLCSPEIHTRWHGHGAL